MAVGREHNSRCGWVSLGFKVLLLLLINQIHWSNAIGKDKICYHSGPGSYNDKDPPKLGDDVKKELETYYDLLPVEGNGNILKGYMGGFPALSALLESKAEDKNLPFPETASSFSEIFQQESSLNNPNGKVDCGDYKCGFDIKSSFLYICQSKPLSEDFLERNKTRLESKKLPDGYLCNGVSTGRFGMKYEENNPLVKAQASQIRRSKVFEKLKDKSFITKLEEANKKNCENGNCKYSKDKFAFICGGQGRSSISMGVSVLAIAILGIGSSPA